MIFNYLRCKMKAKHLLITIFLFLSNLVVSQEYPDTGHIDIFSELAFEIERPNIKIPNFNSIKFLEGNVVVQIECSGELKIKKFIIISIRLTDKKTSLRIEYFYLDKTNFFNYMRIYPLIVLYVSKIKIIEKTFDKEPDILTYSFNIPIKFKNGYMY